MNQKILFAAMLFFFSVKLVSAQYMVKDDIFSPDGVSNQGKVAGYQAPVRLSLQKGLSVGRLRNRLSNKHSISFFNTVQ